MKRQLPSQILEQQFFSLAARRAPLSEAIQLGAQLMLQKAVELEVTEFLGREHYCRSGDEPLRGYDSQAIPDGLAVSGAGDLRHVGPDNPLGLMAAPRWLGRSAAVLARACRWPRSFRWWR